MSKDSRIITVCTTKGVAKQTSFEKEFLGKPKDKGGEKTTTKTITRLLDEIEFSGTYR